MLVSLSEKAKCHNSPHVDLLKTYSSQGSLNEMIDVQFPPLNSNKQPEFSSDMLEAQFVLQWMGLTGQQQMELGMCEVAHSPQNKDLTEGLLVQMSPDDLATLPQTSARWLQGRTHM